MKAQRGGGVIAPAHSQPRRRKGRLFPASYSHWKETIHTVERAGWALEAGLDGQGKFRPIGIRCPDRPARSEFRPPFYTQHKFIQNGLHFVHVPLRTGTYIL
jgi:hypothetical protein